MKYTKRWLAILLALVLTLGVMPMALAEEPAAGTDTAAPADTDKKEGETTPADTDKKDGETDPADTEKKEGEEEKKDETDPAAPAEGETAAPEEKPAEGETPAAPAAPKFTDVAETSPFAAAIDWAVGKGIAAGYPDSTFRPSNTCLVSHILTFLWRANDKPGAAEDSAELIAVTKWAIGNGVTGTDAGDSGLLSEPCTRAMAVTFMWKAAGSPEAKTEKEFTDVAADAEYAAAVAWAVENEITAGTGDGSTFSPDATCTRGQIATFLYRQLAEKETTPAA